MKSKFTLDKLSELRLSSQQLTLTKYKKVKDLVYFMGAVQAQDYSMSKWAVGRRLPGITDAEVEASINKGEIIRTHLLRPTWHLAAAEDVKWMLQLSSPQIKTLMRSANKQLELDDKVFAKSNAVIEKAVSGNKHLTRDELSEKLEDAKISTQGLRGIHIFLQAEMDTIICSGAIKNKKITYASLAERLPKTKDITKEEALVKLVQRYFASHSPATFRDFVWWSGLSVGDAKKGFEAVKNKLIEERVGQEVFYIDPSVKPATKKSSIHLLPAFDEYLISYKSRHVSIHGDHQPKAFTNNGIFKPIIVVNGQVQGTWKRTIKKDKVLMEFELFQKLKASVKQELEAEARNYGKFLGLQMEFKM
ncbi:MAG TPA: winged helix DNA-binding domain-containing protein [Bacteroidia bacterium]